MKVLQNNTLTFAVMLFLPLIMNGQISFKNDSVTEIIILKEVSSTKPFENTCCSSVILETKQIKKLICKYDIVNGLVYDGKKKSKRIIDESDIYKLTNLLKQCSILRKIPQSDFMGISQKKLFKIQQSYYGKIDNENASICFDSLMTKAFCRFDTNTIVINSAHFNNTSDYHLIIYTKNNIYTFIIPDDPAPLSPIKCFKKCIYPQYNTNLNNQLICIVNYEIQRELANCIPNEFKPLLKKILLDLYELFKYYLEVEIYGCSDKTINIWR